MNKKRIRKNRYKQKGRRFFGAPGKGIKRLFKGLICLAALLITSTVLIFCHDLVTQSEFFAAKQIEVTGCQHTKAEHLLCAANLYKGMNILGVNLKIVRQKLLANPWIAKAEVRRKLPSQLIIAVEEHQPMAVLELGRRFLIDGDGVIFKEWQATDQACLPEGLPVISGLDYSDLNAKGMPKSIPYAAVLDLLHLSREFINNGQRLTIQQVSVDREIGLTLHILNRPQTIQLGYHHYLQKYAQLRNVMAYLEREKQLSKVHSIDLKQLERIVIKLTDLNDAAGIKKEV